MNEEAMHLPGHGADLGDAELDAMLAAAEGRLLTAIQCSLDLDAGLAQIIGNPPLRETTPAIPADAAASTREPECLFQAVPETAEMTIETIIEHGEPDPGHGGPARQSQVDAGQAAQAHAALQAHAAATITRLLQEHPAVAMELKETLHARVYLRELDCRATQAKAIAAAAEERKLDLAAELDPAGHRILSFRLGAAVAVTLMILDAFPLNWAAQAFGLNSAGTWLVTFILVVSSVGSMLGLEFIRGRPRRRRLLAVVVTTGYLALLGLRTEYLATVAGYSFPVALLQAAMLTAISAGLVLCGAAVLARTRFLNYSRGRAAARRAAQVADDARAEQLKATKKLQRHIGALRQMLLPSALHSSAPEGVDHAEWAAALEQAIHDLFPR
jgi:hypothetical protein